jgi:hypothetical protein
MVTFETIKSQELKFGKNKFVEVARKKAIDEGTENEFISLSGGFFTPDGTKRFRKNFSLPIDKEVVEFVIKNLKEML